MVIDGYQWLFMVINVYLNSAMVISVIGGYQWSSVVIRMRMCNCTQLRNTQHDPAHAWSAV